MIRVSLCILLISVNLVATQDIDFGGIASTLFTDILTSVTSQWGNMSSEDMTSFIDKLLQPGGLHHIWAALDDHCSSHFDCGPDACCLQPTMQGKRAFTDSAQNQAILRLPNARNVLKEGFEVCGY
ncbi:unnamed protein product [Didymodactylos carnosus]|uniref:Uncharacterized protein n=1 Tax=Didymodactylos carnosus TaxID=1234261 RepID=A0A813TW13_9BILA|nr:unnamed protein product [Didymodactylos carnosus]CAF3605589.1 unnamed protein product [Didymodactylos carnosus]